jgi:hypothetical protein
MDDQQLGVTDHMARGSETGQGFLSGPGLVEFPVEYVVVDGRAIHEGCIDMGPVEEVRAEAEEIARHRAVRQTVAYAGSEGAGSGRDGTVPDDVSHGLGLPSDSAFLWTNGRVAWAVDGGVPNQQRIADAIAHLEQNTGIRFTQRTAANQASWPNWIQIRSNGTATFSSSAIGMRGGQQDLKLADAHPWPILVHEFLHALGVYHEQSRSDRDSFVEIKWDNIQDGPPPAGETDARGNFQTKPGSVDYFDYDYGSIMHYHGTSFAKDSSKPTIVPKRSGVTIGQRNGMSFGDRQTIAKIYERFFEKGYSGVWRAGTGRYALWANATWDSFRGKWEQWSADGLRLVDVHVRATGAGPRFSGVFLAGSGGHALWANASWDSFRAKWQEFSNAGLRLHDVHVHHEGGQDRYTGVFLAGSGGHGLWAGVTFDSFVAKWQEWSAQGLRLHDVHVHSVGGQDRYTGVFLPGSGGHGLWAGATWPSFVAKWQEWARQGLRLVDLNVHRVGTENRYTGAFLAGADGYALWANVTWDSFVAKWQEFAGQGLRLVDYEFVNPPAGVLLDGADAGVAAAEDLPEEFGGIVAATTTAAGVDGYGGAQTDERVVLTGNTVGGPDGMGGAQGIDGATGSGGAGAAVGASGSGGAVLD